MLKVTPGLKASDINAYSDAGALRKERFHREGRTFLRALAKELGMEKGTFEVRSNEAGIAVSGEVTLHADSLYVQLSESCMSREGGVDALYRSCKSQKDYTGGTNHFANLTKLSKDTQAMERFVEQCKSLMANYR